MLSILRDLRFAIRKFWRAPGLALAAIVTLALGIGPNTAIFSMVDGVWLRPLDIADPSHLVVLKSVKEHAAADSERETGSSYAEYQDLRQRVPALSDLAASTRRGVAIDQGEGLKLLLAQVVSENYFDFMGAHAQLGRLPSQQEMLHADTPVMVLGYAAWKSVFAGNPAVVGSTVKLNHGTARIVGVLTPGFRGTERMLDPQVYVSAPAGSFGIRANRIRRARFANSIFTRAYAPASLSIRLSNSSVPPASNSLRHILNPIRTAASRSSGNRRPSREASSCSAHCCSQSP